MDFDEGQWSCWKTVMITNKKHVSNSQAPHIVPEILVTTWVTWYVPSGKVNQAW